MRLTTQQLADRAKGIGASDSGAILGVDEYNTAVKVYYSKVEPSRLPSEEETQAAYWGHKREALVAEEYSERTGYSLIAQTRAIWSKTYPWMFANLDYVTKDLTRNVEVKTAGYHAGQDWGEPGTDEVPDKIKTQDMHQMIVSGIRITDNPVLINGNDFRIYTVPYDKALAKIIIEKEQHFWHEHVLKKIPPDPEELRDLDLLYPEDDGSTAVADENALLAISLKLGCKQHIKQLETETKNYDMIIKGAFGDASVLIDDCGEPVATWENIETRRLDQKRIKKEEPDFAKEFTTITHLRVLRIKKH